MLKLVLTGVGPLAQNVALEYADDPVPAPGEAVVALEAANINPADFYYSMGWYGIPPKVGATLGNEAIGRVVAVGDGVDQSWAGQRVIFVVNGAQGVWAERVATAVENLVPVGDQGEAAQLAQLGVNPLTAHVLLTEFADLRPGDWVGQTPGASAVGKALIVLARRRNIRTLSMVRSASSAEQVRDLGSDAAIITGDGQDARISDTLGGSLLSLGVDGVGGGATTSLAQHVKPGGTIAAYSVMSNEPSALSAADLIYRQVALRGWWIVNWLTSTPLATIRATYSELAELVESGELRSQVDSTFGLPEWEAALARAAEPGRSGKVLFTFEA